MKKHAFILICLLSISNLLSAQIYEFEENDLWGFMDQEGNTILPPSYDYIYGEINRLSIPTSYFLVEKNGKFGIYKAEQGEIVPPVYAYLKMDDSGYFITAECNDTVTIYDANGYVKAGPEKDLQGRVTRDGLVVMSRKGRHGAWDPNGDLEIPYEQDWIQFPSANAYLITQKDERKTLWSREGRRLIEDFPGNLFVMSDSLLFYQPDFTGPKGLMDTTGRKITEPLFDNLKMSRRKDHYWYKKGDLWGMMDRKGNRVLEPTCTKKGTWIGPLGIGEIYGKLGLFNAKGDFLTEMIYDEIQLYEGAARLRKGTDWSQISFTPDGELDNRMKLIVTGKMNFSTVNNVPTGAVTRGNFGRGLISTNAGTTWFFSNDKWGLRDSDSINVLIPPSYDYVDRLNRYDLTVVSNRVAGNTIRLEGLVDHKTGTELLKPSLAGIFRQDFQAQSVARAQYGNGAYVLVNRKGIVKKLGRVSYIGPFDRGIAVASKGGRLLSEYEGLSWIDTGIDTWGGIPKPWDRGGKWGFLGRDGEWKLPPEYQKVYPFHEKVALVKKEGKWGTINRRFKTLIEPLYDSLAYADAVWDRNTVQFRATKDSLDVLLTYEKQRKYYFFDTTGTYLYSHVLDTCNSFKGGMARVRMDEKWGFINKEGEMVIEPQFERASDFREGLARVRKGMRWGYINTKGEFVVPPKYYRADDFEHGLARVRTRSRYGFIDHQGNWVINPKYRRATDFGYRVSIARKRKKYGVMDMEGKWLIRPRYSKIIIDRDTFIVITNGVERKLAFDKKDIPWDQAEWDRVRKKKETWGDFGVNENSEIMRRHYLDFLHIPSDGILIGGFYRQIGIVHKNGTLILPPSAERIAFNQGLFRIYKDAKIGYLTPSGRWVRKI